MIEKLDKFMAVKTTLPADVFFQDALKIKNLRFLGLPFLAENKNYTRIKESYFPRLKEVNEKLITLGMHTAGVGIIFKTNSSALILKTELNKAHALWNLSPICEIGFDLYFNLNDKWEFYKSSRHIPANTSHETILFENLDESEKEVLINFPAYSGVVNLEIGLSKNACVLPGKAFSANKKWLFYGTSITQGGCASRPGMSYVGILSRYFNKEIINFGFSGNGKAESIMAEMIAEIKDLEMLFIDIDANAVEFNTLENNLREFLRIIRKHDSNLKIILISRVLDIYQKTDESVYNLYNKAKIFEQKLISELQKNDKNIYFLDGKKIFSEGFSEYTVDGLHFSDLGYYKFAEYLKKYLKHNFFIKI